MSLYPLDVEISEASLARLISLYKKAYADITREIEGATNFGVANRKAILKQIESTLYSLGVDIDAFLNKELPKYYKLGADQAVAQLTNVGADVGISEGFNVVHSQAIKALVDDTGIAFAESMRGLGRSANLLMGRVTRELITQRIGKGIIGGEAAKTVKRQLVGILADNGLSVMTDKSGRQWTAERYAEMLFKTKVVESRNRGLINRLVENGYDLIQVSSHNGSCRLCGPWERQILSISGNTKGYPTLAQAESAGLFHPNCRHAINGLAPSIARKTRAYDSNTATLSPEGASIDIQVLTKEKVQELINKKLGIR